jgi:hypothetical protein
MLHQIERRLEGSSKRADHVATRAAPDGERQPSRTAYVVALSFAAGLAALVLALVCFQSCS